jgi:hypothetical protein
MQMPGQFPAIKGSNLRVGQGFSCREYEMLTDPVAGFMEKQSGP